MLKEHAMIDLTDIIPLSDFQRNAKQHIQRLRKSGRALVLTVNGRAAVIVRDAAQFQELLDQSRRDSLDASLRRGIADIKRGRGGVPFDEAFAKIKNKYIDENGRARVHRRKAS